MPTWIVAFGLSAMLAQQADAIPSGGVMGAFGSAVVGLLAWFVKRQIASTDKAVEALKQAVDVLALSQQKGDRRYRRMFRMIQHELREVKGMIVKADKVVVQTPSKPESES